jgi:PAS domain S-box-containing protein
MNRFIRFDENNVAKVIVRYSFILVSGIALTLAAIYTPKYYYEYKDNIESTTRHLNKLFQQRIKFEVDAIVSNTEYRRSVHTNYLKENFDLSDNGSLIKSVKKIVLDEITSMDLQGSQEYIFVYELLKPEGGKKFARMLINPNRPDLVGNLIDEDYRDIEGFEFRNEFMRQIRISGEAFVSYMYKDPNTGLYDRKTSYFKYYPEFNWIFAQGYYAGQISEIIEEDVRRYKKDFIFRISLIIGLIIVFLSLYYYLFRNFSRNVQDTILRYRTGLEEKNKMLLKEIEQSDLKQKELSEYSDYISKIYESIPVGIVLIDTEKRTIEKINDAGLETLGYKREELIGRVCNHTFCPSLVNKCPIIDEGKEIDNAERIIVHKSGKQISVLKKACRIKIKDRTYILESFIDITKIKEAEKELIRLKDKAEQASFEKSRFLANMSHEIRTPMNAIYGMSEILDETDLSQNQKEIVETIKASSNILVRILNDILDLSKIESGKISVENSDFELRSLIKTVSAPFEMRSKKNGIAFSVIYMPEDLRGVYYSDSLKLSQVINNLLGNAFKFTDSGSVTLTVELLMDNDNSSELRFCVKDTGIGIEEKYIERIFERFSQADISTTRKYGGTGLGLTISKKLIELLEGNIKVESESGKGSMFCFSLEMKKSGKNSVEPSAVATETTEHRFDSIKILVAEDNPFNQKYITALLSKKSADFKIVGNGKEVLDELEKNSYDIILMDGQMPEMDGITAAKMIRSSGKDYQDTPIIALTASALIDDRKKFIDAGMNDYISKPVDQNLLFKTISKYCTNCENEVPQDNNRTQNPNSSGIVKNEWEIIDITDFESKLSIFGRDEFFDIVKLLKNELPEKIKKISSSLEENNGESMKFEAHSLKGISLNFSAPEFNKLCIKLDKTAESGSFEDYRNILGKIKVLADKYVIELEKFIILYGSDYEQNRR